MFVIACFLFFICLEFQIVRFVISTLSQYSSSKFPSFYFPPPPFPRQALPARSATSFSVILLHRKSLPFLHIRFQPTGSENLLPLSKVFSFEQPSMKEEGGFWKLFCREGSFLDLKWFRFVFQYYSIILIIFPSYLIPTDVVFLSQSHISSYLRLGPMEVCGAHCSGIPGRTDPPVRGGRLFLYWNL